MDKKWPITEIRFIKDGKDGFSISLGYLPYHHWSFSQDEMKSRAEWMGYDIDEAAYFIARDVDSSFLTPTKEKGTIS